MAIGVSISTPLGGLGPEDPLTFVITPDSPAPDTLTATVTFADGSQELAWQFDQTAPGYTGSLVVSGGMRTYTIQRIFGWPPGALSLDVEAGMSGGGGGTTVWTQGFSNTLVYGPTTFTETDTTTVNSNTLLKSIAINFGALPNDDDLLFLEVTVGEVQVPSIGVVEIWVGGTATGRDGSLIWASDNAGTGGTWVNINTAANFGMNFVPAQFFANPNPSGTSYVKLFGKSHSSGLTGFRNFTMQINHGITGLVNGATDCKTIAVPWNTFGAGTFKVTATGTFRNGAGWLVPMRMELRAEDDATHTPFGVVGIVPSGSSQTPSTAFQSMTFEDEGLHGGAVHDLFGTFASPGVASHIILSVPFDIVSFNAESALLKDYTITIGSTGPDSASALRAWTVAAPSSALVMQALGRVIIQYRQSTKLLKSIAARALLLQQVADVLVQIPALDDISTATGANLDIIGELVGESRVLLDGTIADDGKYRVLILCAIGRNNARVSNADYLAALVQLFSAPVVLDDTGGMTLSYTVLRPPTADEIAVLDADIVPRPMGVKVARSFVSTIPYFGFQGDPNAGGFSDHTGNPGAPLAQEF